MKPTTTYPALVGHVLGELRKQSGLDQQALAAAAGVTQPTWSRIESGSSALTIEQLGLAARAVGRSPSNVLALADAAAAHFVSKGGKVEPSRLGANSDEALGLIGAAAIGALIGAILARS